MTQNNKISKIGFSKIGGIFIGKDIVSDFHKHYALTVILSFGETFKLYTSEGYRDDYQFVLIQKNIDFNIKTSKEEHVDNISKMINLSTSHFNWLFKKETGLTFRRFVLHSKLIKSISAIHEDNNLTKASFIGGFSDQPHLTRTFKENFGIKPSKILK